MTSTKEKSVPQVAFRKGKPVPQAVLFELKFAQRDLIEIGFIKNLHQLRYYFDAVISDIEDMPTNKHRVWLKRELEKEEPSRKAIDAAIVFIKQIYDIA